jgi:hypothetical protein
MTSEVMKNRMAEIGNFYIDKEELDELLLVK